ncbi:MAG TPA: MarR family winged helix-turn-helix transcriptional regulator [Rhizomicrobium sp.]
MIDPISAAVDRSTELEVSNPASVEEFAKAVSMMNRFLAKFAALKVFAEARLTVTDWTVMMYLLDGKGPRYPFVATFTGISEQRVIKIAEALVATGLISSTPSRDPTRPHPILSVTDLGKARLDAINNALHHLLAKAVQDSANTVPDLKRNIPYLMLMV